MMPPAHRGVLEEDGTVKVRNQGWSRQASWRVFPVLVITAGLMGAPGAHAASRTTPDDTTSGLIPGCSRTADPAHSVARHWDEAILSAIRRDLPRPTVHARNLFHVSAGMWDAWAAYDPVAQGYFVDEHLTADDVEAAREEAISFAAYRILTHRYAPAVGGEESLAEFDRTLGSLCYDRDVTIAEGDSPVALGNRIAATIIEFGLTDGANEQENYADPTYQPVNAPLIVSEPGATLVDPDRWQPLALEKQVTQNDIPIPGKVQAPVGPHWGHVASFGLPTSERGLPIDPGTPPTIRAVTEDGVPNAYKEQAVAVIRASASLDPSIETTLDISPGSLGNNDLGTNDGDGWSVNPFTGEPYEPVVVRLGDYARALAEFWADGPSSETPPGHWNSIANAVADTPDLVRRIGGTGDEVGPLEWDVKTYFALNGAVHDAAVAAWGAKGFYDSVRPISMIRYMAGLGQSSDPDRPSYHKDGLPLVRGLIELVTRSSSQPGRRHEALRDHIGEIAIKAWSGNPEDPTADVGGVDWILGVAWLPYQKATFVTPAFPGFVSGHSTFSRAAAEVMTAITGSAFFPGGLGEFDVPAGGLTVELGPTTDVPLQWATYYDAADQAGVSRIYGGIHIPADDFGGRQTGYHCGKIAWALAQLYFDGSAPGVATAS
jgi:hypothetical protein